METGGRAEPRRWGRGVVLLFLLAAVAFGSAVRIRTALADPNFDSRSAEGMLKSDPALLYYFVGRIVESGGAPPPDFRADARIEHPARTDIPSFFTVGQEFLVAWSYLLFGGGIPLHVFCVWAMGIFASFSVLGVFGLAREVTGSSKWASAAAALFVLLPANYRTIGFILVREDFSFPFFALHLWLLARAARVATPASFALAGLSLGIAMATWHAMGFFVAIEAACLLAWFLRTGEIPFAGRGAWLVLATAGAFCLLVPALRTKLALLSLPMQIALATAAVAALEGSRGPLGKWRVPAVLGAWGFLFLLSVGLSRSLGRGISDYSHVYEVLWAKLTHLGRLPADPREISFDARLLWQGPFNTLDLGWGFRQLFVGAILLVPAAARALPAWLRGREGGFGQLLPAFAAASIVAAYFVERTIILPGLLLPVAGIAFLRSLHSRNLRSAILLAALALQAVSFGRFVAGHRMSWYEPPQRQAEIAHLVRKIPELVPEGEAIAADFMNGTAILAHTRRPIVLQPKYETEESRRRAEEFLRGFFEKSPDEFRKLILEGFRCRYLLVDRYTLWTLSRYAAGIPWSEKAPRPGTAAEVFLSRDERILTGVPGYRLLYRSPEFFRDAGDELSDWMRLYALEP